MATPLLVKVRNVQKLLNKKETERKKKKENTYAISV